jgi:hypothetical protein
MRFIEEYKTERNIRGSGMNKGQKNFSEFNVEYPCEECSSPCCKYIIVPYKTPNTWMDIDFVKYLLNFPKINVTVSKDGAWCILVNQDCIHFDAASQKCKIHQTPEQPKTCSYFNPYQCNYKSNLYKDPSSIYILDREKFEHWVQFLRFDENGRLVDAPSFEKSNKILDDFKNSKDSA